MEKKHPFISVGITGSAGSGKSLVGQWFRNQGYESLDCDRIARQVVEPGEKGLEGLIRLFGTAILDSGGRLDRAALRRRLVGEPGVKEKIDHLLHPLIRSRVKKKMARAFREGAQVVAVEVPLLFESGMADLFDVTLAVVANSEILAERICTRDGVSRADARGMLALQMDQRKKAGLADYVIENSRGPSELFESVEQCFAKIRKEVLTI